MELLPVRSIEMKPVEQTFHTQIVSTDKPFILANTVGMDLHSLKTECVIPVFAKDNETTISHNQFIEAVYETANQFYRGETILDPSIRVSHEVKGRIPEAMGKPAHLLMEDERTVYYERMAFTIEVPSIFETIAGNPLSLCVGGVRA